MSASQTLKFNRPRLEKYTFRLHLISQILNGISFGTFLLMDVILKKSLGGSDFQVTVLIFLTSTAFMFSIYGAELINRVHNQQRTILWLGFASKFFLFIIPLYETPNYFIFCIAVMSFIDSMIKPVWNVVIKHNYSPEKRSSLYSYASSLYTLALLVTTTSLGFLLDINYEVYKIFYPLAGVVDMIAFYNLAKLIKLDNEIEPKNRVRLALNFSVKLVKDIIILPIRNMLRIFNQSKGFLRFEIYFFLYGMAFMMIQAVLPIFLVEDLALDYTPISLAKGFMVHSAIVLFTPLMGKLMGSRNPAKFTGVSFITLVLFPILLLMIKYFHLVHIREDILLYVTFFIFGISMSGVTLSWNLGSIYYAPHSEVSNYQAVHITLTGLRGLFSPFLGYLILKLISIEATFIFAALLFFSGGVLMVSESRKGE